MKLIRNEKGFAILFTIIVTMLTLLIACFMIDGGIILHYRHQLQTAADAGSTAGIQKTIPEDDGYAWVDVLDPNESVKEAQYFMRLNLWDVGIINDNGATLYDKSDTRYVDNIEATPLSDKVLQTKITGHVKLFMAPLFGRDPYESVSVISQTKLIDKN
jgi:Flp pilus assembly protein TadG